MKKYLMILVVLSLMLTCSFVLAEAEDATPTLPGIDLTPLFQAVIAFLAALVSYKLVPWIQARTTAQQQEMLRAAVSVAVYAAEQLYGTGNGKEKLMYVKGRLAEKGFKIDIDEIESAVREMTLSQGPELVIGEESEEFAGLSD